MTRNCMINTCNGMLRRLDELQTLSAYMSDSDCAFVTDSVSAVTELYNIAKYETERGPTAQQASHMLQIQSRIAEIFKKLPGHATDEHDCNQ